MSHLLRIAVAALFVVSTTTNTEKWSKDDKKILRFDNKDGQIAAAIKACRSGEGYVRLDEAARSLPTSLLDVQVPPYLENFNNPCWIECYPADKNTTYPVNSVFLNSEKWEGFMRRQRGYVAEMSRGWRLRCLPKFYLIGLAKCGTTDLQLRLRDRNNVLMGLKEIRWWSGKPDGANEAWSWERFLDVADLGSRNILATADKYQYTTYNPVIFGDYTPETIFANSRWKHYITGHNGTDEHGNMLMTPHLMSTVQPEAKIIAILRNPVTMTYSTYTYFGEGINISSNHFHECCVKMMEKVITCQKKHAARYCAVYRESEHYALRGQEKTCRFVLRALQTGQYVFYLEEWYQHFPVEQIRIVRLEEYSKTGNVTALKQFLDLPGVSSKDKKRHYVRPASKHMHQTKVTIKPMMNKTIALLTDFFHKYNQQLAAFLHDDGYLWS